MASTGHHTYFLGLAAYGFNALWGSMMRNGAVQAIGAIKSTGILPSGDSLTTNMTGVPLFDGFLLSPVIFYDALMYERHPVHRSLLVSVFTSMQATAIGMLVNGINIDENLSIWSLVEHAAWGIFNQAYGAAFVYPLYCLVTVYKAVQSPTEGAKEKKESGERQLPDIADREAIVYTSIAIAAAPLWLLYPAFFQCSSISRQLLIASYRVSPALLASLHPFLAFILRRLWPEKILPADKAHSQKSVQASLLVGATTAALGHIYAILTGILSHRASFAQIFFPSEAATGLKWSAQKFLQKDILVIIAALVPFSALLLRAKNGNVLTEKETIHKRWAERISNMNFVPRVIVLTGLAFIFSPGFVYNLSMAW
ncbi:hypothetical protein PENVUL_c005G06284 [Penicillium vulpinum]|uniref:Uncharacterized protein n=2 Tax=Penicillium vulpinum TaxID=29845 RepID=A0A1V6S824_9EURO|nr:hypothetical protein PENVUL_c005G06284 [Penicillium vulpinum]